MPLYAMRAGERFAYEIDGTTIYYERISHIELEEIKAAHTKNGVLNWPAAMDEALRRKVKGWDNFCDPVTETEIPFQVAEIVSLPPTVKADLTLRMQEPLGKRVQALGNSNGSSNVAHGSAVPTSTDVGSP